MSDDNGSLRRFVNVYLRRGHPLLDGLRDPVADGAERHLPAAPAGETIPLPAAAGMERDGGSGGPGGVALGVSRR